jgi:hypothetical protein
MINPAFFPLLLKPISAPICESISDHQSAQGSFMIKTSMFLAVVLATIGCGPAERMTGYRNDTPPNALSGSIFPSDIERAGNDEIGKVLDGKIPIKEGGHLAVLPIGNMYYVDSGHSDDLRKKIAESLAGNKYIGDVCRVPRMLLAEKITVPIIREIGARLQCENVLVYTSYDNYRYKRHVFSKDEIRASLTVEAVLINVRTGCIPIAMTVDEESIVKELKSDDDKYEFIKRAQRLCLESGLMKACDRINKVLSAVK